MSDPAIIVLNAGSSSLKFSLYRAGSSAEARLELHANGQIEGLGSAPKFHAKDAQGQPIDGPPIADGAAGRFGHPEAFAALAGWLRERFSGMTPAAIGHRVVHGGPDFSGPVRVDAAVLEQLKSLIPLAPLHQPHNLEAIKVVMHSHPALPQVACFDTAFHHGRAAVTQRFGLPRAMYDAGVRRYGFHGLSYESISRKLPQVAPDIADGRVVVAHLGSGASMCAMREGRSVDTTMAFSVLDGLPMGTRCGSLDPGVLLYLMRQGMNADQIERLLYQESGLRGMSGVSNDVRALLASDKQEAAEALEYFVYRIIREVGSLTSGLGGLDGLVFTAGIGENSPEIRRRVCEGLKWLGVELDADANERGRGRISRGTAAQPSVWVIPTDEESVIADATARQIRI